MFRLIGFLIFLSGCISVSGEDTVLKRAGYDLDCSEKEIKIIELSPNVYAAEGCGKKETYACKCSFGVGLSCTEKTCQKESTK